MHVLSAQEASWGPAQNAGYIPDKGWQSRVIQICFWWPAMLAGGERENSRI
nr:MAG TPA: hypothetical protein [Caudoviricetes sp.]